MVKGSPLSTKERTLITQKLAQGLNPTQIGKHLNRDTRTIKKAIQDITYKRKTHGNKGNLIVSKRDIKKNKGCS